MRKKIVAGNWKMNMDLAEGLKFAESIDKYFKEKPSEGGSYTMHTLYSSCRCFRNP